MNNNLLKILVIFENKIASSLVVNNWTLMSFENFNFDNENCESKEKLTTSYYLIFFCEAKS